MSVVDRRPPMHGGYFYGGEHWTIHPKSWSKNIQASFGLPGDTYGWNVGNTRNSLRYHSGSIQEHADAALYYATWGLVDPTNVADIGYWKGQGYSTSTSIGLMFGRALIGGGIFGWMLDPADKRKGGLMQTQAWKDVTHKKDKKFLHFR